jgi:hypothetical protein
MRTQHRGIGSSCEVTGHVMQQWEFWLGDDAHGVGQGDLTEETPDRRDHAETTVSDWWASLMHGARLAVVGGKEMGAGWLCAADWAGAVKTVCEGKIPFHFPRIFQLHRGENKSRKHT